MPGIVGCITRLPREEVEADLLRMVEALGHEDFYIADTWLDEALGVYVGWVARRGSFADEMPLQNEQAQFRLAFSGKNFLNWGRPNI